MEEIKGVYGGITTGEEVGVEASASPAFGGMEFQPVASSNLPATTGFWSKFKSVLFYEIKVELTPKQQKIENEINEFLHQEITWTKVKDFLFQEVTFGKKNV